MKELDLKRVQELSLDLLCEFDRICRQNGLEYYICGGTLLGAVRHHGFIPWDDDADVMMLRDDYEKLIKLSYKLKLDDKRVMLHNRNRSFARHYLRYARTDYVKRAEGFEDSDCPYIGLDVFPIDFVNNDDSFRKQVKRISLLRSMLLIGVTRENMGHGILRKALKAILRPFIRAYGINRIADKMERTAQKYSGHNTGYVAGLCGMYGLKEIWSFDDYKRKCVLEFQGNMLSAPERYDIYLSNLYGDYMKLPPKSERKAPEAVYYAME